MHDHGTPSGVAAQRAVLSLVLDARPNPVSIEDLAREIDAGDAVDALVGLGLLIREGDAISASAAAVHFDGLELP